MKDWFKVLLIILGVILGILVAWAIMKRMSPSGGDPRNYVQYLLSAHGAVIDRKFGVAEFVRLPNNFVVVSVCRNEDTLQCHGERIRHILNNLSSTVSSLSNFRDKINLLYPDISTDYGGLCVSSGNFPTISMVPNQEYGPTTKGNLTLYGYVIQLPARRVSTKGLDALRASKSSPFIETLHTSAMDPREDRDFVNPLSNPALVGDASEYLKDVELVGDKTLFQIISMLSERNANKFTILFITSCQSFPHKQRIKTTTLDNYVDNIEAKDRLMYRLNPRRTISPRVEDVDLGPKFKLTMPRTPPPGPPPGQLVPRKPLRRPDVPQEAVVTEILVNDNGETRKEFITLRPMKSQEALRKFRELLTSIKEKNQQRGHSTIIPRGRNPGNYTYFNSGRSSIDDFFKSNIPLDLLRKGKPIKIEPPLFYDSDSD